MTYYAIGLMSGSSLDGLDICYARFEQINEQWQYQILATECSGYNPEWENKLKQAIHLSANDYMLLHCAYGKYIGQQLLYFIQKNKIDKIDVISSHGHTTFHVPAAGMTGQIGDGATIAAITQQTVVSDLRQLDVANGGQGAPIVPMGEKLLLHGYDLWLNLGGIANISCNQNGYYIAFDICAANRVMNMLCATIGKQYDDGGQIARTGILQQALLGELNKLEYYNLPFPKSLANDFGTDIVYPIIEDYDLSAADALHTYVEHIAWQIKQSVQFVVKGDGKERKLLATGGGAFNNYLIERIQHHVKDLNIRVVVPDSNLINFKEALVMALLGVLRIRNEATVLHTVTGANKSSIGGAVWNGR